MKTEEQTVHGSCLQRGAKQGIHVRRTVKPEGWDQRSNRTRKGGSSKRNHTKGGAEMNRGPKRTTKCDAHPKNGLVAKEKRGR